SATGTMCCPRRRDTASRCIPARWPSSRFPTARTGGSMGVEGLRAVVTGAASGIGKATADLLRAGGATVTGVDLHGAEIDADVTDQGSLDAAAAAVGPP